MQRRSFLLIIFTLILAPCTQQVHAGTFPTKFVLSLAGTLAAGGTTAYLHSKQMEYADQVDSPEAIAALKSADIDVKKLQSLERRLKIAKWIGAAVTIVFAAATCKFGWDLATAKKKKKPKHAYKFSAYGLDFTVKKNGTLVVTEKGNDAAILEMTSSEWKQSLLGVGKEMVKKGKNPLTLATLLPRLLRSVGKHKSIMGAVEAFGKGKSAFELWQHYAIDENDTPEAVLIKILGKQPLRPLRKPLDLRGGQERD